jgi:hypothetical protein
VAGQIGLSTRTARAILEVLRPLTGTPSTGTATITASSADVIVPARCFLAPIRKTGGGNAQIDRDNLIRTTTETTVTSGGTSVPIISMLGGKQQNWPAGTQLRFDPVLEGVEEVAVTASAMTGGASATGVGAVSRLVEFEEIGSATAARDILRAKGLGGAPIIILTWDSAGISEKISRGVSREPNRWTVVIVVARTDSGAQRRNEGRDIMDAVVGYLGDRSSIAGHVFSAPPTRILSRKRVVVTETSYVYAVEIETLQQPKRIETRGETSPDGEATYVTWRRMLVDINTADVPPFPVVDDLLLPALEFLPTIEDNELVVTSGVTVLLTS